MSLLMNHTDDHTEYDEEHIRASEAIDRLLARLNERRSI